MKDEKGKLPSLQFYPADWRGDPGVQSLTYHERGVWFEILCMMHVADTRGKLTLNGKPMPIEALARALGLLKQDAEIVVSKLLDYGVASRDKEGSITCRRMVRDEEIRLIRKAAGAKGGNPNFKIGQKNPYYDPQKKDNPKITPPITAHKQKINKEISKTLDGKDNQTDNQKITPSSSSSSLTSTSFTPLPPKIGGSPNGEKNILENSKEPLKQTPRALGINPRAIAKKVLQDTAKAKNTLVMEKLKAPPESEIIDGDFLAENPWKRKLTKCSNLPEPQKTQD